MIVNCPNCSLEQPLDPFCAGCGKQLPKLIAEQRRQAKARNKRTQKFILLSVLFFSLGFYIYYAYQNPEARPFNQITSTPTIKLTMPKGKIFASKYSKKDYLRPLKVTATKDEPKPKSQKKTKPLVKKIEVKKTVLKIQEVYLIKANNCADDELETGPLSDDELLFFLNCAQIVLKLENNESLELDPNLSFANSISFNSDKKSINLNIEFAFEDPIFKTTKVIGLNKTKNKNAGYLSEISINRSTSAYITEKPIEVQKELLGSYASSALLSLQKEDKPATKGYFLAVYE